MSSKPCNAVHVQTMLLLEAADCAKLGGTGDLAGEGYAAKHRQMPEVLLRHQRHANYGVGSGLASLHNLAAVQSVSTRLPSTVSRHPDTSTFTCNGQTGCCKAFASELCSLRLPAIQPCCSALLFLPYPAWYWWPMTAAVLHDGIARHHGQAPCRSSRPGYALTHRQSS